MLILKRNTRFNELLKCKISKEFIAPGDYYYQDDENPKLIIKATVYREMEKEKMEKEFDYTKYNNAQSFVEYQNNLKEYERQFLQMQVLNKERTRYNK